MSELAIITNVSTLLEHLAKKDLEGDEHGNILSHETGEILLTAGHREVAKLIGNLLNDVQDANAKVKLLNALVVDKDKEIAECRTDAEAVRSLREAVENFKSANQALKAEVAILKPQSEELPFAKAEVNRLIESCKAYVAERNELAKDLEEYKKALHKEANEHWHLKKEHSNTLRSLKRTSTILKRKTDELESITAKTNGEDLSRITEERDRLATDLNKSKAAIAHWRASYDDLKQDVAEVEENRECLRSLLTVMQDTINSSPALSRSFADQLAKLTELGIKHITDEDTGDTDNEQ